MNDEERRKRIAEAAYYRSERRGFAGDHEVEDWLAAEREVLALGGADEAGEDRPPVEVPDQASGVSIPAPLAKEERIRAEEVKQSAHDLSVAATEAAPEKKPARKPAKKSTKSASAELRRSL